MPTLYTTIGPWTFPTFNLFLTLAVLVSAGVGLRHAFHSPRHEGEGRGVRGGTIANLYLVALIGAVACARLFHVLLNWDYFADALNEIMLVSLGGLDWHGAVLGAVIGLFLALKIHHFVGTRLALSGFTLSASAIPSLPTLLDTLTPALPLLGLAGWWGCLAASCGYGAEVDNLSHYPAFTAAESADVFGIVVPRYNTQLFGLLVSALVLLFVALLFWRGWLLCAAIRRFWLTLFFLSIGMFGIGFFRGDHTMMLAGLRGDQLLDLLFAALSLVIAIRVNANDKPVAAAARP